MKIKITAGKRVVIEGKFSDTSDAQTTVLADATKRINAGIAHMAVAVVYPQELRATPTAQVLRELEASSLNFCILTESLSAEEWIEGTAAELMETLRRAQESLAKSDFVEATAKTLSIYINGVAELWQGQESTCDRLSDLLGTGIPDNETSADSADRRASATKVAALQLPSLEPIRELVLVSRALLAIHCKTYLPRP